MQALDPSGVYPAATVIAALTGKLGTRVWDFRYDRLDASNKLLEPVTTMMSATVTNDSLAAIKRKATFTLLDTSGINYLSDRIKPYARLRMPDGGFVEWPLGVFLLASPKRRATPGNVVTREVAGYDQALVLQQDKVTDRYSIAAGTVVTTAIATLVAGYTFIAQIVPSTLTLPAAREWPPGTSVLTILNDLLAAINYSSVTFDENGALVCKPYMTPASRTPDYVYADDASSMLTGETEQDFDLYDIPNKWLLIYSEADSAPLVGTYTNANPLSPTSTVSRGRTIADVITESDAADAATLNALAANAAFQRSQVYETVPFNTPLMPIHSDSDVIALTLSAFGLGAVKYAETSWSLPLVAGGIMAHSVRRVVPV